jgi:FkbM family methyltransferase
MVVNWFSSLVSWTSHRRGKIARKGGSFGLQKLAGVMSRMGLSVTVSLNGCKIVVPANHASVFWVNFSSTVNRNLGRVAACIAQVEPESTMVDVGANVGDTWLILRAFRVQNRIVAVEGGPEPLRWLRLNTRRDTNVTIHEGFVGFGNSTVSFEAQGGATSGILFDEPSAGLAKEASVRIASLDEILHRAGAERVRLIKIDTDGFDTLVARSAEQTILRDHPILFLEMQPYHLLRNDNVPSFVHWLRSMGYTSALCWDNAGRYLCEVRLSDLRLLSELLAFFHGAPEFPFMDVAYIHEADSELKREILDTEKDVAVQEFRSFVEVSKLPLSALDGPEAAKASEFL